jgi:hypothetical protein
VRQPILATEIPLMLPVTLEFGMEQPSIEQTNIRRQPLSELRQPCDVCGEKDCNCAARPGSQPGKAMTRLPGVLGFGEPLPMPPTAPPDAVRNTAITPRPQVRRISEPDSQQNTNQAAP